MSGNPLSIQHQGYARLLSEITLQGTGTHRTSCRQAQTLQAYRTPMREDGAELRLVRRACSRLHLDQIRPHGLDDRFHETTQLHFEPSIHGMRPFRTSHMIRTLETPD